MSFTQLMLALLVIAIVIFLMAKVVYAEQYAKLVFDQRLHDALLNSVLAADPIAPNLTLINTLAQERAKQLMMESNDYF